MSTATTTDDSAFSIDGDALIRFISDAGDGPVKPVKLTFRGRQDWSNHGRTLRYAGASLRNSVRRASLRDADAAAA